MRAPIELDLHLPNFNFPGVAPGAVFERLVEIAVTAEQAGITAMSVMDHYHQIPPVGPPSNWMFEGNTILSAIAARTQTIALGLLVAGVTYRNPAQYAKVTTTIDIVSGGRAFHGIGAGWFEAEHESYGYTFPPMKERFERLEDHLRIVRAMFTQEQSTVSGTHHSIAAAYNNPQPLRGDIPILVGGSGERKTLRMVAQYADGCNLFGDTQQIAHLLGVLEGHCETVGRDPAEITKTTMMSLIIDEDESALPGHIATMRAIGFPQVRVDATVAGTPEQILKRAHALREAGIEGLTFSMPAQVHDPEAVALAAATLGQVFGPRATA